MSFFTDIMKMDAAASVDPELMPAVELVTYIKRDSAGTRSIYALVDRGVVESVAGVAQASVRKVRVSVANDATLGISSVELDNGDMIELDLMLDGRLVKKSINMETGVSAIGLSRIKFELM